MEVKINREIRNYTEAMFFGLSMRQFIFSACACVVAVGTLFPAQALCRHGNRIVDVHFGSRTLCGSRLYQIQRNDGGEVRMGLVQIRVSDAEETDLPLYQHLLRDDEARNGTQAEGGIKSQ